MGEGLHISRFIVCSYYTPKYAVEANGLVASCIKYGVPVYVEPLRDLGSWDANTHYKPTFIKNCLKKFNCDVVYIDADARFEFYPTLFENLDCDMAFYEGPVWNGHEELLSGTIFVRNSEATKRTIALWEKMCGISTEWDQVVLQSCLDDDLRVRKLPVEYCAIFDAPTVKDKSCVIKHYQASRRFNN
jgi:hypothetical protein